MRIAITQLPRIVERLFVGNNAHFVILEYNEFVKFVAAASASEAPDVVAVLDQDREHVFVVLHLNSFTIFVGSLDISGGVDERHYLATHSDVKAAVEDGRLPSATHHYIIAGYFEARAAKLVGAA